MAEQADLVVVLSTENDFLHVGPRRVVERHVDHLSEFDVFDEHGSALTLVDAPQGTPRLLLAGATVEPSDVLSRIDVALDAVRVLAERVGEDPDRVPGVRGNLSDTLADLDRQFVLAPVPGPARNTAPADLPVVIGSDSPDSHVRELTANASWLHRLAHRGRIWH